MSVNERRTIRLGESFRSASCGGVSLAERRALVALAAESLLAYPPLLLEDPVSRGVLGEGDRGMTVLP